MGRKNRKKILYDSDDNNSYNEESDLIILENNEESDLILEERDDIIYDITQHYKSMILGLRYIKTSDINRIILLPINNNSSISCEDDKIEIMYEYIKDIIEVYNIRCKDINSLNIRISSILNEINKTIKYKCSIKPKKFI